MCNGMCVDMGVGICVHDMGEGTPYNTQGSTSPWDESPPGMNLQIDFLRTKGGTRDEERGFGNIWSRIFFHRRIARYLHSPPLSRKSGSKFVREWGGCVVLRVMTAYGPHVWICVPSFICVNSVFMCVYVLLMLTFLGLRSSPVVQW